MGRVKSIAGSVGSNRSNHPPQTRTLYPNLCVPPDLPSPFTSPQDLNFKPSLALPLDLPARIASHDELWHPLVKDSTITGRMGATGFQLLQRLVSAALDIATGAPEGAGGSGGGAGERARCWRPLYTNLDALPAPLHLNHL